jgi:RHS repeat-associated protein
VTQTKTNVLQYNEYYAYGLQTANSWTRENTTGNNFLGNGGTELNTITGVYDLEYRNYDPILGRMNQVDPMASQYSSLTPYNYSFNDPVTFNDPDGADPIKKEPLPTDANPDPGTGWGAWHLPGGGGGMGPGSGNHWSDRYSGYFNSMPGWTITIDFNQMRDGTYFGLDFTNGHVSNFTQYSEAVAMGDSFGAMIGASQWVSNYVGGARLWGNSAGTHFSTDGNPVMVSTGKRSPVQYAPVSAIPVYGDFQRASYWADHNDWSRVALYGALAVTDMAGITGVAKALAKSGARMLITQGGKYVTKQAARNPVNTFNEVRAMANPRVSAMMRGKGVDRAFREMANNNLILGPAQRLGILEINPMNRGADMVGKGLLNGTWWDVTTQAAWQSHMSKYGAGGIGLFYP